MPYKTAIDCIEELATQCFLSKLTDDDVSTFRRACSRENDIIKLALKVPQTVDYTSILRLLYDTLPLKFLSFNEALPLFVTPLIQLSKGSVIYDSIFAM